MQNWILKLYALTTPAMKNTTVVDVKSEIYETNK